MRLRYILGGDRPSQTTRLALFTAPIQGTVLEAQYVKGGISRLAPPPPKRWLHSLPPILSEVPQTPISGCSKGSRGLSVLPRVLGIFTETAISPSPSVSQRSTRSAIRAGRNLPDKEFRYLRTVIVTAAVYRGFGLEREPRPLTFRHWAGLSPYTSTRIRVGMDRCFW